MKPKIIIDLCGGTGAWSEPYRAAGYRVYNLTLPEENILRVRPSHFRNVYGVLFAAPCTFFAVSGNRWLSEKPGRRKLRDEALRVVAHGLYLIHQWGPLEFWALENPIGTLRRLMRVRGIMPLAFQVPRLTFDPCDYGDPWKKRTQLYGRFNLPKRNFVQPRHKKGSSPIHRAVPGPERAEFRAITPPHFSKAFFLANR